MARKIIFGTYDTETTGLWTLAGWSFPEPEYVANFVNVPGRVNGPLDLSAALTGGKPVYGSRELAATLESSEGTRLEREARISTMVNWLTGWSMNIELPDDDAHYIVGRVHVAKEYNDLAHCAVTVTAVCEPWRYAKEETEVSLTAATDAQTATLVNSGRKDVVPLLTITGDDASVNLTFGTSSWALGAGTYLLPDLVLQQGSAELTYSGTGALTLTYREAVL